MSDYISKNLTTILLAAVTLFAGIAVAIAVTIKIRNSKKINRNTERESVNKVVQKNNRVSGDLIGRDKR